MEAFLVERIEIIDGVVYTDTICYKWTFSAAKDAIIKDAGPNIELKWGTRDLRTSLDKLVTAAYSEQYEWYITQIEIED